MRVCSCLMALLLVLASAAEAQWSTADGVRAIARGDYAAAAGILQPLAEGSASTDPLAQFFIAALYGSGRGVAPDPVRACGLYLKAAGQPGPLTSQAAALAVRFHQYNPALLAACADALLTGPPLVPTITASPFREHTGVGAAADAFVRGDYQRAAELLTPVIDRWPVENDEMADFLMAAMYEGGHGVQQDPVRACALYVRAPISVTSSPWPPVLPVVELGQRTQEILGPDQMRVCFGLSQIGFDSRFQAAMFTLGPEHWISFELSPAERAIEATINYQFQQKTMMVVPLDGAPGVRFLPIEHTELQVRSQLTPRHFVEFFTWQLAERG